MQIFDALGFKVEYNDTGIVLLPPDVELESESRARLLRAWVELSAWIADYMKRFRVSPLYSVFDDSHGGKQHAMQPTIGTTPRCSTGSGLRVRARHTNTTSAHIPIKVRAPLL